MTINPKMETEINTPVNPLFTRGVGCCVDEVPELEFALCSVLLDSVSRANNFIKRAFQLEKKKPKKKNWHAVNGSKDYHVK